ncbi:uncharacterized protein MONBRDRAFT_23877 [Monosiga brevicollis MX1]|uniref:Uncharacterized protein n=1 Tax=Monosiga brevicollis TaxID=81824 RepID=A9UV40_MONBE|nr:uncharacterized protein MONBRDRAFT_23877 [Monosiga brevicollis MX1]EDQ90829.1 predicted protein [Monosiga brevicollis MX1]|eukprot:XP_001744126.1 hypothetical protein [Monosiga brevicollis MX1]
MAAVATAGSRRLPTAWRAGRWVRGISGLTERDFDQFAPEATSFNFKTIDPPLIMLDNALDLLKASLIPFRVPTHFPAGSSPLSERQSAIDARPMYHFVCTRLLPDIELPERLRHQTVTDEKDLPLRNTISYGQREALAYLPQVWPSNQLDYHAIDASQAMHEVLAAVAPSPEHVHLRQFRYVNLNQQERHDLTVAAYTLSEQPNLRARRTALELLWAKTERYMVLIEHGYHNGFQLLLQAREWLMAQEDFGTMVAPDPRRDAKGLPSPHLGFFCHLARISLLTVSSSTGLPTGPHVEAVPSSTSRQRAGEIGEVETVRRSKRFGKACWEDSNARVWGDRLPPLSALDSDALSEARHQDNTAGDTAAQPTD